MIIVQLKGGLGNQLFQYAAALALAEHHHTTVKADIAELTGADKHIGTLRSFDLQQLQQSPEIASPAEMALVQPASIIERLTDKLQPPYKRKVYKEKDFTFDKCFFKAGSHIYLKGYRQSEKYFRNIEAIIRKAFCFKDSVIASVVSIAEELRSVNSVSVHIRRGDYSNPVVKEYHGILQQDYYQAAIRYMETHVPGCIFYIFSDDPDWVAANLQFTSSFQVISGRFTKTHFEDFYLITQCRHQVIANSTFSWWAAWLNNYPGKIVVAPQKWFNQASHNTSDLLPESWIKI